MFALMQRADQNQNLADRLRTVFARRGLRARRAAVAGFTMIEIMIVVLIIGILLSIAAPNFAKAREQTRKKSCVGNLRQIQYAKDAYLMDNNLATTVTPADTDLYGPTKYIKVTPLCPGGGTYSIGNGNQEPTCSYNAGGVTHVITDN